MELVVRKAGELVIAAGAVDFARLFESFTNRLLAVVLAGHQLEERFQVVGLDHRVASDVERADLVARTFRDRNPQLDPAGLLVVGVLEHLQLRGADVGAQVAVVAVVGDDLLGVLVELGFLVGAAVADQPEQVGRKVEEVRELAAFLGVLQLTLQGGVADRLVADEVERANLDLRPFVHVEREVDQLGAAGDFLDLGRDFGELEALLTQHVADDAGDLADQAGIDEGVEADLGVGVLQLLVDLRRLDLLGADVVDDLDALPLLHVVGHDLADRAVGELVVADVDEQVIEEVRVPQPVEVLEDDLLAVVVPGNPHALRRQAGLQLDVIEVGLGLDDRGVALGLEARRDEQDHRSAAGRRLCTRRLRLPADRHRRQRRGWSCAANGRATNDSATAASKRTEIHIVAILDRGSGRMAVTPVSGPMRARPPGGTRAARRRGRPRCRRPAGARGSVLPTADPRRSAESRGAAAAHRRTDPYR